MPILFSLTILSVALLSLSTQLATSPSIDNNLSLRSSARKVPQKIALRRVPHSNLQRRGWDPIARIDAIRGAFTTLVTIGSQTFSLLIDTGSGATWIAKEGVYCFPGDGVLNLTKLYDDGCGYKNLFDDDNAAASFQPLDNASNGFDFKISYAGGQSVDGFLGTGDVSIAGLTVSNHTFALVEGSADNAAGTADGILGLSFSSLNAGSSHRGAFPSLTDNIFAEGLTGPNFSIALSRDSSGSGYGGSMMFGGVLDHDGQTPDVNATEGGGVIVPMLKCGQGECGAATRNGSAYSFYTIMIDELITCDVEGSALNLTEPFILDTGTTDNLLPTTEITAAVNSKFAPPASYDYLLQDQARRWVVACNATITERIGFSISGEVFYMNPEDMILQEYPVNDTHCQCANQNRFIGPGILGEAFLKNVLAVFDVGGKRVGLKSREFYSSPTTSASPSASPSSLILPTRVASSGASSHRMRLRRRNVDQSPGLTTSPGALFTDLAMGSQNLSLTGLTGLVFSAHKQYDLGRPRPLSFNNRLNPQYWAIQPSLPKQSDLTGTLAR